MSATRPEFTKQQELANKKHSKLEDHEKIYLMKKEIDNLKIMLRDKNNGSLTTTTSSTTAAATNTISSQTGSSTSSSLDRAPVLTLFLFVGVLLITLFRRKQRQGWNFDSRRTSLPLQDQQMTFELQEALDYEAPLQASPAVSASANIQFV
jgi:hypothetical protein